MDRFDAGKAKDRKSALGWLKRSCAVLMCAVLAVGLVPASAFAQLRTYSGVVIAQSGRALESSGVEIGALASGDSPSDGVAAVRVAAEAAIDAVSAQGFEHRVLKDAFEAQLDGSLCYSVGDGVYHVLYSDGYYVFTVGEDASVSASVADASDKLSVFDTVDAAREAIAADADNAPAAFLTRALVADGDRGHALYQRTDGDAMETVTASGPIPKADGNGNAMRGDASVSIGLDLRIGDVAYKLASAEDAISIYQLGYAGEATSKNAALYFYMFQNTDFHTFVLPEGEYPLDREVWTYKDERSYYGLGETGKWTTLVAGDDFVDDSYIDSVIYLRGKIEWNAAVNEKGETVHKYDIVHDIEMNGIGVRCTSEKGYGERAAEDYPNYRNDVLVRCADNVSYKNAVIYSPQYWTYVVDIHGMANNVTIDHVTAEAFAGIEIRDLDDQAPNVQHVKLTNSSITASTFDEGLAIFAGGQQGLKDENGNERRILKNCLVKDILVENNTFTFKEPNVAFKKRVVAVTCGYQDSPVENVTIRNNTFDVVADNYFMLFGYATDCTVENNTVTMRARNAEWTGDSSKNGKWVQLITRSALSRTGPTTNVQVHDNSFTLSDKANGGDYEFTTLLSPAFKSDALAFERNEMNYDGYVNGQFINTAAQVRDNTFNLGGVKSLYRWTEEVSGNTYNIDELTTLYEAAGTKPETDIVFTSETVHAKSYTKSALMSFYGGAEYGGNGIVFDNCTIDMQGEFNPYRRIAGSDSKMTGAVNVTFAHCIMEGFDSAPYNTTNNASVVLSFVNRVLIHNCVSDMVADGSLAEGDMVTTKAYYAGGTNGDATAGAGKYDIEAHDDWADGRDDGGRYLKLANGKWAVLRVIGDIVDLYQYGAAGDGVTDDAAQVQAALDSGAGTVSAGVGTYLMSSPAAAGGVALTGAGASESRFVAGEEVGTDALFIWRGGSNCGASGVTFDGAGVAFDGCSDVVSDGLAVANAHGDALSLADCKDVSVAGLAISGYALGGDASRAGVSVSGDCSGTVAGAVGNADGSAAAYAVRVTGAGCNLSGLKLGSLQKGEFPVVIDSSIVAYTWASDYGKVTATPKPGGVAFPAGAETAKPTSKVAKKATTTAKGKTTYTVTFSNPSFTKQSKTVANIAKLINVGKASITLSATKYVYNGGAKKPAVTVKLGGKTLKRGAAYTVDYSTNKNVGTARVTVKGKGFYGGSKAVTFKINPKATSLSKLTAAKKGFTAKWAKRTAQTSGYQLQYSLKKNFKSAKTVTVAKTKTTSKKVTKLKPKKRYYVRVRTYKKAAGKTYYSTWSKAKAVTTKK